MTQNSSNNNSGKSLDEKIKFSSFPLTKTNFILMAVCLLMIVVGFALMLGSANEGAEFNNDIFSARRVVVGPTMAFIGFVAMAFAIIYHKPAKKNEE
ncbi:MAG: DUF3098 domain-containing protein [Muribaculaceae bacterium]|nr:DUF3098 domain-containing protein [Muribaculaceae bacterium]